MTRMSIGLWAVLASCGGNQTRIAITQSNDLGVVAIETDRFEDNGAVFALRGLDASDHEVARVYQRIGTIPDLGAQLGSELVVTSGTYQRRLVSRQVTDVFPLYATTQPALQQFLELSTVSAILEQDGNLRVIAAGDETALAGSQGCASDEVLTSPTAHQCCRYVSGADGYILFVDDNSRAVYRSGPHGPCTSSTGGSCSGTGCYYGPYGYSFPSFGGQGVNVTVDGSNRCAEGGDGGEFSDVTGSLARGVGCPGGNDSSGAWDY